MSKIVIDARESGTSTGRYVDKLIEYLRQLKPEHEVVLLAKKHRLDYLKSIAPSFKTVATPYREFTFGEQVGFKRQIDSLHADLVHFPMVQQPVWYRGRVVTTMQDLTGIRFRNPGGVLGQAASVQMGQQAGRAQIGCHHHAYAIR
jgi:hypothetical protein